MRALPLIALAATLCLAACGKKSEAPSILAEKDDAALIAAGQQARATLPAFWALYYAKDPSRTRFAVNARMATGSGGFEAIWVGVTGHDGDKIGGVLANEPNDMPQRHLGTAVQVSEADIEDWSYEKDGKLYGSYTTRAVLPRLPKDQQTSVAAQLAPSPTEQAAP